MGSNYFGSERERSYSSSSSSSSSRKGKKNGSEKPKQPQRGLGVAQLEKIRLHTHLASTTTLHHHHHHHLHNNPYYASNCSSSSSPSLISYSPSSPLSYAFQGHHMMGLQDLERTNITYGDHDSQSIRWHHHHQANNNAAFATQHFVDPTITRPFFEPGLIQGSQISKINKKKDTEDFMGSSNHNSSEDIDLELRLSL